MAISTPRGGSECHHRRVLTRYTAEQEIEHMERNIRKERDLGAKVSVFRRSDSSTTPKLTVTELCAGGSHQSASARLRTGRPRRVVPRWWPRRRSLAARPTGLFLWHRRVAAGGEVPRVAHAGRTRAWRRRLAAAWWHAWTTRRRASQGRSFTKSIGGVAAHFPRIGLTFDEQEQRARSVSRERAALAGLGMAGDRILTPGLSPHRSPYLGAVGGGYGGGLPGRPLGHRRSWSGTLPGAGMGHLGYGHSPRLLPHGHGGGLSGGLPGVGHLPPLGYRSRSPSAGRVLVSPRIGHPPSPRVVNYNHNTYNISPHHRGHELGVGGLGALDDLHLGGGAVDPILLDEYAGGAPGCGQDFVVTDASLVEGRRIRKLAAGRLAGMPGFLIRLTDPVCGAVRDLGAVEGFSGLNAYQTEDERLNLAIADLTARAQARGANAVLSVETGEDVGGQIVVRGLAALLP